MMTPLSLLSHSRDVKTFQKGNMRKAFSASEWLLKGHGSVGKWRWGEMHGPCEGQASRREVCTEAYFV